MSDIQIKQEALMSARKSPFKPIRSVRTFEEVASQIKEFILEGTLRPGEKLLPEAQMAKEFNVGRQTVREALRLLELSGFITIQKGGGGGSFIQDTVLGRIGDMFLDAFRMKNITLEQLTFARLEIERVVLKNVIEHSDESDIERLQANVNAAKKKLAKNQMATEENFQFHTLLAEATKNHVFVIVVEAIMAVHADVLSRTGFRLETSRNVVESHEEILSAIMKKDHDEAIRLLEEHLRNIEKRLNEGKAEKGEPK